MNSDTTKFIWFNGKMVPWADAKVPQQGTDGKTTLQVPVENVTADDLKKMYNGTYTKWSDLLD